MTRINWNPRHRPSNARTRKAILVIDGDYATIMQLRRTINVPQGAYKTSNMVFVQGERTRFDGGYTYSFFSRILRTLINRARRMEADSK